MILWLCGSLPWEKLLDPATVQKEKEKAFNNVDSFLNKCFHGSVPQAVHKFITLLANIKFNEIPSYEKLKETLISGLKKLSHKPDGKLKLDSIGMLIQQNTSKRTPQNLKKPINGISVRKSPRMKQLDTPNSRKSTIGVVIDKKRCNVKDIVKALDDMDSDSEYDIQILKKAKKTESVEKVNTIVKNKASSRRKKVSIESIDDSEEDSNIKVITKLYETEVLIF